jgi:hypothetical protein
MLRVLLFWRMWDVQFLSEYNFLCYLIRPQTQENLYTFLRSSYELNALAEVRFSLCWLGRILSSEIWRHVVREFTDVSRGPTASILKVVQQANQPARSNQNLLLLFTKWRMEVETSVNFYWTTRCHTPKGSKLYGHRREDVEFHTGLPLQKHQVNSLQGR